MLTVRLGVQSLRCSQSDCMFQIARKSHDWHSPRKRGCFWTASSAKFLNEAIRWNVEKVQDYNFVRSFWKGWEWFSRQLSFFWLPIGTIGGSGAELTFQLHFDAEVSIKKSVLYSLPPKNRVLRLEILLSQQLNTIRISGKWGGGGNPPDFWRRGIYNDI